MKIHLIFNAHIDPVWLWPWQAGLDELLATCRSACDRLDAHPDLTFTRGEAWVYRQIERIDTPLFERIRGHVATGRWEIVGGWWLQPDCNLPGGAGMHKQIELGKRYFEETFGIFPRIAYNVDSFGHAATLPGLMRSFGQDRYVMMRPQEHEMALPSRLFRWRGYEDEPEVVTFRIAQAYTSRSLTRQHIEASLTHLPPGIEETMCFVGVGDHGGGPTESQIAWLRENQDAFPGHQLVFSSPRRFFDAIQPYIKELPLVTGELQQHAIGCYSVYRPIKSAVQKAEHALEQAEVVLNHCGITDLRVPLDPDVASLDAAWQRVCFGHFHDTLGGTCLPSAYGAELDRLAMACSIADETRHIGMRRLLNALPDDQHQRIVLFNASRHPFDDFVEFEPWMEWQSWGKNWWLSDLSGKAVPFQILPQEALMDGSPRLLFRTQVEPGAWGVLRIMRHGAIATSATSAEAPKLWTPEALQFGNEVLPIPLLQLLDDPSDTWSHGIDRYSEDAPEFARWEDAEEIDNGPLLWSWKQLGRIGQSALEAEWRTYAGAEFFELRLKIHWCEKQRLLKLVWPFSAETRFRHDGISGGLLRRPNDGRELPLRDWMHFSESANVNGVGMGVLCPDSFAADATPERLALTLLRSPLMAHHAPHSGQSPRRQFSDQGQHTFRFRFYHHCTMAQLESAALALHQSPLVADLTRGMLTHLSERHS